jgi:hypothetical protein
MFGNNHFFLVPTRGIYPISDSASISLFSLIQKLNKMGYFEVFGANECINLSKITKEAFLH